MNIKDNTIHLELVGNISEAIKFAEDAAGEDTKNKKTVKIYSTIKFDLKKFNMNRRIPDEPTKL